MSTQKVVELRRAVSDLEGMLMVARRDAAGLQEVSDRARSAFHPGGVAHRISLWYDDEDGDQIRALTDEIRRYVRMDEDAHWASASLAEKRLSNELDREYRVSRR